MISPNEINPAPAPNEEVPQTLNRRRLVVDFIFRGSEEEAKTITAQAAEAFLSVFRDVVIARIGAHRLPTFAVRCQGETWKGPIFIDCLKDQGFGSL